MTLGGLVGASRTLAPDARRRVDERRPRGRRGDGRHARFARGRRAAPCSSPFAGQRADGARVRSRGREARRGRRSSPRAPAPPGLDVPWLATTDARLALAELAAIFYGHPSDELVVVGVTGHERQDDRRRICSRRCFEAAGLAVRAARHGDVPRRPVGGRRARRVAHDARGVGSPAAAARDGRSRLQGVRDGGVVARARRCTGSRTCRFRAAIFTNLTRDHLDFHGDMQQYFAAKRRLFEMLPAGAPAVVNVDDPRGAELAARQPPVDHVRHRSARRRPARCRSSRRSRAWRSSVETPRGRLAIRSPLVGRPNVYNILGVVGAGDRRSDLPLAGDRARHRGARRVPGRFQIVSAGTDDVRVVVDYAHTDDALKNLLETARAARRRAASSRCSAAAAIAIGRSGRSWAPSPARLSDCVVLTSDNPRSEDPARIIEEIKRGLVAAAGARRAEARRRRRSSSNADRRAAIEQAIRTAEPGDLVLIAGKGHEKYQVIGDRTLPFDDVDVARDRAGAAPRRIARVTTTVSAVVLTAAMVAQATGRAGSRPADRTACSTACRSTSRSIAPGALFVALTGERFDGHAFVAEAIAARRRRSASSSEPPAAVRGAPVIRGRRHARRRCRRSAAPCAAQSGARVVAITGSAGKTTTKEVTAELLSHDDTACFATRGNLNNHIGLPLSLIELRHGPDVAVVELGMNHAGEIRHARRRSPSRTCACGRTSATRTSVISDRVEAIARAKAEDARAGDRPDTSSSPTPTTRSSWRTSRGFPGRTRDVRRQPRRRRARRCDVVDRGFDGTTRDRRHARGPLLSSRCRCRPRAARRTCWRRSAVAIEFDVPLARDRVDAWRRSRPSPAAVASTGCRTARVSSTIPTTRARPRCARCSARWRDAGAGRRIAVLGEMLELGDRRRGAARARAAGRPRAAGVDELVVIGGPARMAWRPARSPAGSPRARVHRFADSAGGRARRRATRARRAISCSSRDRAARARTSSPIGCRRWRRCSTTSCYPLATTIPVLHVCATSRSGPPAASLTALAISLLLGPWMIRRLRAFQIGQVVRQDGPASHKPKAGTPTMGGLLILTAVFVPTLLWADLTNAVHLDRRARDGALRRDRFRRRLPEGHAAQPSRSVRALQVRRADRRRRSPSASRCCCSRANRRRSTTRG